MNPQLDYIATPSGTLTLRLAGAWTTQTNIPPTAEVLARLESGAAFTVLAFDCAELSRWDSRLLTFLKALIAGQEALGRRIDRSGLPRGIQGMLALANAVPEREDVHRIDKPGGLLALLGGHALRGWRDFLHLADFIGETCLAFGRLLLGRSCMRAVDLGRLIQGTGPHALPIISLIAVLVGMILAFVGAVQLKLFGAQVFIADLVGLGMAREMGAMMTAILMAGRTGAAYAAELGSMTVNDEIDALKTSGFSPMEFLVLPRILALFLTIPFLCLYADILGILGGALVAAGMFDVSFAEYRIQIQNRLRLIDFEVGIGKSAVFGILVAIAGCMRGLQCQRNATAVGLATTSAVVTGIVYIVISDAIMTLLVTTLNVFKR